MKDNDINIEDNDFFMKENHSEGKFILNNDFDSPSPVLSSQLAEEKKTVKLRDHSFDGNFDLLLILNDNDCRDTFFQNVCEQLLKDGIMFTTTSKCKNINCDRSVVITIDQLYSTGPETLIFAPYDNARLGESDALVLAMYAAFKQNNFAINEISAGKTGFRENEDGTVSEIVQTDQEEIISRNLDISFVTISLGTRDNDATIVARAIENGLARFYYYLNKGEGGSDLIYRADAGEKLAIIAEYFHSTVQDLVSANQLDNTDVLLKSKAIINPSLKDIEAFSENVYLE